MDKSTNYIIGIAIAVGLLPIALYISGYRIYKFPSKSMVPAIAEKSFHIGKLSDSYRKDISRFDVLIYESKRLSDVLIAQRVVGLPGETVEIKDDHFLINGAVINAPPSISFERPKYSFSKDGRLHTKSFFIIPRDHIFVIGDNMAHSADSRYIGTIPIENVVGYLPYKLHKN